MDQRLFDKNWRINHLYNITNKNSQRVQFKPNKAQQHFQNNHWSRNIILKSRQLGFTTFASIDSLDDTLFKRNFNSLLVSYDKESSFDIFDNKIDFAWKNLLPSVKALYKVDSDNKNTLKFDFGDNTFSRVSVRSSGRSGTYNRVHISEMAKICRKYPEKAKEIITGTIPAVPLDGRVDIESTAEGEYGDFYEMFWLAWDRGEPVHQTEYKAFFYNWTWDEDEISKITRVETTLPKDFRDLQKKHNLTDIQITYYYLKWLSLNKDWGKLRQEYPTTPEEAFIASGFKLFTGENLEFYKSQLKEGEKVGEWILYKEYNPSHVYVIGADVAEGVGQDSSTAIVLDLTKNEIVAEYASNRIEPDMFAYELRNGSRLYGWCMIAVERNNTGLTTVSTLKTLNANQYQQEFYDEEQRKKTKKYGWRTDGATKPMMMYELKTAIDEMYITIPSRFVLAELRTYDKNDLTVTRFDPEQTKHWDRIIALAIAWQMRKVAPTKKEAEVTYSEVVYSGEPGSVF